MLDLIFPVRGDIIPSDHNYRLYSALTNHSAVLKRLDWQLTTITGYRLHNGVLRLGDRPELSIRCHQQDLGCFAYMESLSVGKYPVGLGTPRTEAIKPKLKLSLKSRIVLIKNAETEEQLERSLLVQAQSIGIDAHFFVGSRKTIRVKHYTLVGFEVFAKMATEKDSILLQENGLGGKRRMGCGVFC